MDQTNTLPPGPDYAKVRETYQAEIDAAVSDLSKAISAAQSQATKDRLFSVAEYLDLAQARIKESPNPVPWFGFPMIFWNMLTPTSRQRCQKMLRAK